MHIFIWKEIFIIESKMAKIRSIGIIFEMLSCRKLIGHEYAYLAEKKVNVKVEVCWINPFTWKKLTIDHNMDEKNNFLSEQFLYQIKPSSVRSRNFIVRSHTACTYIKTIFEKFCNMVFSGKFTKTCIVNMNLRLDI